VFPGSPAAEAGLEQWDVVVAIDGKDFASPKTLVRAIRRAEPGETLALGVLRNGERLDIEVHPEPRSSYYDSAYRD